MTLSIRIKTVLVLLLTGLSVYLGLLNVADRLEWKQADDGIEWIQREEGVVAASVQEANGVVPVLPGDLLLEISGIPIRSLDDLVEVHEALTDSSPQGTRADYTVRRGATVEEITFPAFIRLESQIRQLDVTLGVVAFVFLGIGLFIFLRHVGAAGAFHFYLICLVAFILFLFRYSGRADLFDLVVYWCSAVALLLLPPMFLHFCGYFPAVSDSFRRFPSLKWGIYVPALVLLSGHLFWFSGQLRLIGLPRVPAVSQWIDRVHLAFFLLYFGLATVVLIQARRKARTSVARKQMKWILDGTLVGLIPFGLLYGMPFLLGVAPNPVMEISVLSLALIPLSFGYAISRYRLMDVELIFKNGVAYVLTSSALLGVYVGIVLLISLEVHDFSPESSFVLLAVSALLVAFLFAPLKDKIQDQIDRYFYREQYDYRQSISEFGKTLGSEISLILLSEKIVTRIRQTLGITPVALFLREEGRASEFRLIQGLEMAGAVDEVCTVQVPDAVFKDYDRMLYPHYVTIGDERVVELRTQLWSWGISFVQPLRVRDRIIGFLGLGRHANGDFLTSEDRELISALVGYAAIAVDNALLYRSLELKAGELAQLKLYNENVIESITLGVSVVNPEGQVTVWNNAMHAITGVSAAAAIGHNVEEALPGDIVSSIQRIIQRPRWILEEPAFLYKTGLHRGEGDRRLINITLSPFVSEADVNTGTLMVFDDVTEKARLESQLRQAEKLSSIGLFAAGLAHEVNTPLAGICSYTQMLLQETPPDDPRHEILEKVERQSFRASDIINNLLNFARFSDSDFQEINVNSLMTDTLSLLDHQMRKSSVEVELDLDPTIPRSIGNGSKLQQVFMNLFLNARDAMPGGGKIAIRTSRQQSDLVIQIRDSGTGISPDDIKKIYDPFFTTKAVGKGTGLGLSVSYGIIQEHSGRITVDSALGKGTTFTLYLPVKRVN